MFLRQRLFWRFFLQARTDILFPRFIHPGTGIRKRELSFCLVNQLYTTFKYFSMHTKMINSPEFHSIFTPELNTLLQLFSKYNYEIRIAGGAVRDILLGQLPKDIDFATNATPSQMKEMFDKEGIRMINAKGEKHGTITARINEENFEVTTLRIDVVTDGRHAEVEFTQDWQLDSNRRDLTVNSMFLGSDGKIYDYFGGYEDLKNRRILFVGDPATRIREDYLRILRYFRFYGRISDIEDNHDKSTLKVIQENIEGIGRISGERIWMELRKIIVGRYACSLVEKLKEVGAFKYIGLPDDPNLIEMRIITERSQGLDIKPITALTTLLKSPDELQIFHTRCKLSTAEKNISLFLIEHRETEKPLKFFQRLLLMPAVLLTTREQVSELFKYRGELAKLTEFEAWPTPKFPLSGKTLSSAGVPGGKSLGNVLNKLKAHWIDNDFTSSQEDLLQLVPSIAKELNIKLEET